MEIALVVIDKLVYKYILHTLNVAEYFGQPYSL